MNKSNRRRTYKDKVENCSDCAAKASRLADETRLLKEELLALSPKECARYVSRKVKALLKE